MDTRDAYPRFALDQIKWINSRTRRVNDLSCRLEAGGQSEALRDRAREDRRLPAGNSKRTAYDGRDPRDALDAGRYGLIVFLSGHKGA